MKIWALALAMAAALACATPGSAGQITDEESVAKTPWTVTNPDWLRKPSGHDLARFYPDRAQREEVNGSALIACSVRIDGRLEGCRVINEAPPGYGFGAAALNLSSTFRMRPASADGMPTAGGTVRIPIIFRVPQGSSPGLPRIPPLVVFSALASLLTCSVAIILIESRRRDRGLSLDDMIEAAFLAVGRLWRRAPLPMLALTIGGFAMAYTRSPSPAWAAAVAALLITSIVAEAAAYALLLRAPDQRLTLPHAARLVVLSMLMVLVLTLAVALLSGLAAAGVALGLTALGVAATTRLIVFGGLFGVCFLIGLVLGLRLTLIAPVSIQAGRLSTGKALAAGRGRVGALAICRTGVFLLSALLGVAGGVMGALGLAPTPIASGIATALAVALCTPIVLGGTAFVAQRAVTPR